MIKKFPIEPTYRKENGLWNLPIDSLPLPKEFVIYERNIVFIPLGEFGGNHKHPRSEAFVGIGENLYIIWQNEEGKKQEDKMMDGKKLYLFVVEPFTPHVVVNHGNGFAILVELADGPNVNVERAEVLANTD
jgi:hypothetical protein